MNTAIAHEREDENLKPDMRSKFKNQSAYI